MWRTMSYRGCVFDVFDAGGDGDVTWEASLEKISSGTVDRTYW